MTPFRTLVAVEARRALHRRLVRVLLALGAAGAVVAGVIVRLTTVEADLAASSNSHIGRLADVWRGDGDAVLPVTVVFLGIGALIGGASVVGAEWRWGTVTTTLTWTPRRGRLLAARLLAAAALAAVLSLALQALLALALVPTWLGPGTTDGVDAAWLGSLLAALARSAALCALAAGVGGAVASIGRNTTAALAAAFVELSIVEGIVRGAYPRHARWLVGENVATVLTWRPMTGVEYARGPALSALTLAGYLAVLVVGALVLFRRRDLVGAT